VMWGPYGRFLEYGGPSFQDPKKKVQTCAGAGGRGLAEAARPSRPQKKCPLQQSKNGELSKNQITEWGTLQRLKKKNNRGGWAP